MKNFRKIGVSLIGLTSILALSACSSGNDSGKSGKDSGKDGKEVITFSHWGGDETYKNTYKDRISEFEKENPTIKVKVITVADGYDTKLQTMFAGKEAPDVVQVAENGQNFASKKLFEDLSSYIQKNNIDTKGSWGDSIAQYTYDSKIFGLPDRGGPEILYYNKDMFDKAGLSYPTVNWTVDDYTKAMEKLTIKDGGKTVQYGASSLDWTPQWGAFINSNGGNLVTDGKMTFDTAENLKVLKWYKEVYDKGWVTSYQFYENVKNSNGDSMFSQGKVAMLTTGFWNIRNYTQLKDLNFDIAPMPIFKDKTTWPFGSALTISKQSKHKDAAFKFIDFMTGEKGQKLLGETLGDSPANLKVLNSDGFINRQVNGKKIDLSVIGESAKRIKIDGMFQGPYFNEISSQAGSQVKEMLLGRLTPEQTVEKIQKNGAKIISKQ